MTDYECPHYDEVYKTVMDSDGYELANYRQGIILVSTPEESR